MKVFKKILLVGAICLAFALFGDEAYAAPGKMADGLLFDAEFYGQQYPDVKAAVGTDAAALYAHYLNHGRKEGRIPYDPATAASVLKVAEWVTSKNTGGCTRQNGVYDMTLNVPAGGVIWVSRTFTLKPNTNYRLSAEYCFQQEVIPADPAKPEYAGLVYLAADASGKITNTWNYYADPSWAQSSYLFNSGENTSITLYFCAERMKTNNVLQIRNIVFDELTVDNRWDMLAVICPDVAIASTGFTDHFSAEEIRDIQRMLSEVPASLTARSGGRMVVSSMDIVISPQTVTTTTGNGYDGTAVKYGPGGDIDFDAYLAGHSYDQVIVFAPLRGYAQGWLGLGGSVYHYGGRDVYVCIVNNDTHKSLGNTTVVIDGQVYNTDTHAICHEILHSVEVNSVKNGWSGFASLHSLTEHGYRFDKNGKPMTGLASEADAMRWQADLMQDRIRDGSRGFTQESFYVIQ